MGGRPGSKLDNAKLCEAIARGHATSTTLLLKGYAEKYGPKDYEIPELYEKTWAGNTPLHLWVEKLQDPAYSASKRLKLLGKFLCKEEPFQPLALELTFRNAEHLTALDMAHDPALVELLISSEHWAGKGWADYELVLCMQVCLITPSKPKL